MVKDRVLIVEDESIIAVDLRNILDNLGYEVCGIASNGAKAIEIAREQRPDLLMMDITLKGDMDGIEAATIIKENHFTSIIFVTADISEDTVQRAKAITPFGYIFKPYDSVMIGVTIDLALQRHYIEKELKEREEKYRTFIENSSEGIWCFELSEPMSVSLSTDKQIKMFFDFGFLTECNEAMARMYGFDSRDDILGVKLSDLLVPTEPGNIEYLRAFIENGYRLEDAESIEVDASGNELMFLNSFVGIKENGELKQAWGAQRDITERKRAEASIIDLTKAKDTLTDFVVHDIKNITTAMFSWLDMLREGVLGEMTTQQIDALKRIIERNNELFGLTEELLDISQAEGGTLKLDLKPFVFENQVREIIEYYHPIAKKESKKISYKIAGGPIVVMGDEQRLNRVLTNLVNNAIKFAPSNTGEIVIRVILNDSTGKVIVKVSDNGVGIPDELHESVFEKYGQAQLKKIGMKKGRGLGLTYCKMIVEAHEGTIRVVSDGQNGSTFVYTLPVYKTASDSG